MKTDPKDFCQVRFRPLAVVLGCLVFAAGCERGTPLQFVPSTAASELDPPLQEAVRKELQARCGTPAAPKLLGSDEKDAEHLLSLIHI